MSRGRSGDNVRTHRRRRIHRDERGRIDALPTAPSEAEDSDDDELDAIEGLANVDESLLSRDERAYREARRFAEQKVKLYRDAVKFGLIAIPLLIFIPFIGVIVLFFGGIDLGKKFYRVMVEPGLRERLVREEVGKQVQVRVHSERRTLEGEHARHLEQLSASIAHEIRNPITAAKSLVQQMGEDPVGADNVEYANVALGELERVERSISHLLRFARDEEPRMVELRLVDVLESALETFKDRSARTGVEITRQFDCEGSMRGDPEKLRRVAINLIGNAIDALEQAAVEKPTIEISMGENLAGTEVWMRIRDNGPGIDAETRQKMFSPFFTAKEGGTGLGLAITKKLIESHAGTIEVISEEGDGAEFVVAFPKNDDPNGANGQGGIS